MNSVRVISCVIALVLLACLAGSALHCDSGPSAAPANSTSNSASADSAVTAAGSAQPPAIKSVQAPDLSMVEMGALEAQVLACTNQRMEMRKLYVDSGNSRDLAASMRKLIAVPDLQALKLLLDSGIPAGDPPLTTGVNRFDCPPESPDYEALVAKHAEEMVAYKKELKMVELIGLRNNISRGLVAYYSSPPFDTDELQKLAKDTLKNDAAVAELVDKVKANLVERAKHTDSRFLEHTSPGTK